MDDRVEWFAPKRYGYGAGLPVSWQGWAVILAYVAIIAAVTTAFRARPLVIIAIAVPVTAVLIVVCARTTRGGWRWRWGGED